MQQPNRADRVAPASAVGLRRESRIGDPARLAALRALCLEESEISAPLDRLTRLAATVLDAAAALVNIIEADRQITRSAYGSPDRFRRGDEAPFSNSICHLSVESREPLFIGDTRVHPQVRDMACVAGGIAAYAGVPLTLSSGYTLGSLCVVDLKPRAWTEREMTVLRDLAASATSELELCAAHRAAEARAEAEANVRRLQAVERITDVALTQATLDDTLDAILATLRDLLRADTATVLLMTQDARELCARASLGVDAEVASGLTIPIGEGIAGRIAATRQPLIVPDVASSDAISPSLRASVQSLLGAPLILDGTLLGVVHVGTTTRRVFDEDDVRLMTLAAARISTAIERARLFDAEHGARMTAEAASRAKSDFLAVMSHELRTPLNAIGGFAQLLTEGVHGGITDGQRRCLERIKKGQERLTRAIDDILKFVDLEQAAPATPPAPIDVRQLLDAFSHRLAERAAAAGIRFEGAVCADDVKVLGDADVVDDILTRVADNAVKYTPPGGRIFVCCDTAERDVTVSVGDSGIGIPSDRLERVFEPFEQADSSYGRPHEGLGLGLAIARAQARRIRADLAARHGSGGGTVVTLTLQRATP